MTNSSAPLAVEHDLNKIEALQVPAKAVNAGFQVLLSLANLVIWLSILPISQILLPTQIAAFSAANKFTNLTIATVVGVLAAVITNPIAGALSDRTTSRLGRRRPWFLVVKYPNFGWAWLTRFLVYGKLLRLSGRPENGDSKGAELVTLLFTKREERMLFEPSLYHS